MERIVLHIDMDAFFAAIEERDKPRLRGLPLVVGADPKGGAGRGVVSTANYAARAYGIHSAQPISTAWRLSREAVQQGKPAAVFLDVDMRRYGEVSRHIMEYLRAQGGVVAQPDADGLVAAVHRHQVDVHVDEQVGVHHPLGQLDDFPPRGVADRDYILTVLGIVVVQLT